jgi:hypothetical protein
MPKRKHPRAPRAPKGDIDAKVDPKLKKLYDELVATIAEASRKEALDFDRCWEAADRIVSHEPPLYVFGGYASADAFYREVMEEEPRNARRYARVARFCSPVDEARYGTTKLDAAIAFVEAKLGKPLEHPPLPVALDRLRIPVKGGSKSVGDATVAEIAAATSKLTASSRKRPATPARAALLAQLKKAASLRGVTVHEHAGLLSFTGVPVSAIHHFIGALTKAKLPVGAKTRGR